MIEVQRDGQWVQVNPEELTTEELCEKLTYIQIEPDEFLSPKEIAEGYDSIREAIRRLEGE